MLLPFVNGLSVVDYLLQVTLPRGAGGSAGFTQNWERKPKAVKANVVFANTVEHHPCCALSDLFSA